MSERLNDELRKCIEASTLADHTQDDTIFKRRWLDVCRLLTVAEQETLFLEAGVERRRKVNKRAISSLTALAFSGQEELFGLDERMKVVVERDGQSSVATKETAWLTRREYQSAIRIREENVAYDMKKIKGMKELLAVLSQIWDSEPELPLYEVLRRFAARKGGAA